jgi:hypothetical protein
MKIKIFFIVFLGIISFFANAQATWQTRFVFELWRDDTSSVFIYDTLTIGLDKLGDVGFQDGLDQYVDSSDEIHTFFVDSAFYTEFKNKKLKKDIRKFPDKPVQINYWSYINKYPRAVYYDTNTLQLYIPPFQTIINGIAPIGSSFGTWDINSATFLFFNKILKNKIPRVLFYEAPPKFFFNFKIILFDSLKTGVFDHLEESSVSMEMNENSLLISTAFQINNVQIEIRDITGKIVFNKSNLSIENNSEIQIDGLTRGVYFATIITDKSFIFRKLFKP